MARQQQGTGKVAVPPQLGTEGLAGALPVVLRLNKANAAPKPPADNYLG